jgi:hypothetical protein
MQKFRGYRLINEENFEGLLRAFYSKPYELNQAYELKGLTVMADYYGTLPILSLTLDGALLWNPQLPGWYLSLNNAFSRNSC